MGLVTCFISISSIIAADAGAYFGGKRFGKTRMTGARVQPTAEGGVWGKRVGWEGGREVCVDKLVVTRDVGW